MKRKIKRYFGASRAEERLALLILEEEINRKFQEIPAIYKFVGKEPYQKEIQIFVRLKLPREERVFSIEVETEKEKRKRIEEEKLPPPEEGRIRRTFAINFRSSDEPYFISIKAITINPAYTEKALSIIAYKYKQRIEDVFNIDLRRMDGYTATEKPVILGTGEDKALNDYKIHTEIFIGGINKKALYYTD